jgi:hypothetical protein
MALQIPTFTDSKTKITIAPAYLKILEIPKLAPLNPNIKFSGVGFLGVYPSKAVADTKGSVPLARLPFTCGDLQALPLVAAGGTPIAGAAQKLDLISAIYTVIASQFPNSTFA